MKKFALYVALAIAAVLPGLIVHFTGISLSPVVGTSTFFAALIGAGFMLSWGVEAAEGYASQGLIVAVLALITVLPEYAVDIYLSYQAGVHPESQYASFAAANMTGANRLLIGCVWTMVVFLYWWKSDRRSVDLKPENGVEIVYLLLPSLYAFVIIVKDRIDLFDTALFALIFAAYLWRVGKLPKESDDDDGEGEVGPAAVLETLPKKQKYFVMAAFGIFATLSIAVLAEPFAESLIATGHQYGLNQFLLIQWLAPLAGEAPEIIIAILFTLALRPTIALAALISDKINQWTLLVGMIPLAVSIGAGHVSHLALDARQHEEFFLTAAQSIFAVSLLVTLRLRLWSAVVLLVLFVVQIVIAFLFQNDPERAVISLTILGWIYLALAAVSFAWNREELLNRVRYGLTVPRNKARQVN